MKKQKKIINKPSQIMMLTSSVLGTFFILIWIIKYSYYGFDFTDESFYLIWISNPFIYDVSAMQFGFIYHPIYKLLDGNISALRQFNILITFGLACGFTYTYLTSLNPDLKRNDIYLHAVSAGLATNALSIFSSSLLTPSYNSLAFQALLITGIGLLIAEQSTNYKSIAGWITIGIGGWLTFMAKPSTALVLAAGTLLYISISRKFSIQLFSLAITSTFTLLILSALLIDGSIFEFAHRLKISLDFGRYLDGGHTLSQILRIDDFQLSIKIKFAIFFIFLVSFISVYSTKFREKKQNIISFLLSFILLTLIFFLVFEKTNKSISFGKFQGLLIFGVMLTAIISGLLFGGVRAIKSISTSQWAFACLLLLMPHIYAFGTNGNYWQAGAFAGIFWLLASLTLLGFSVREYKAWSLILPIVLVSQALTAVLLQAGLEQPYRQPQPLRLNNTVVKLGPSASPLVLSAEFAHYIEDAVHATQNAGFQPNTPVIDLTGQSPGILYAIKAENTAQAWIIGGYPGSQKLAEATLNRVSCKQLAQAWVLVEPEGPRSLTTDTLNTYGADLLRDFEPVAKWHTAGGAGGYAESRQQILYRPIQQEVVFGTCESITHRKLP